MSGRGRKGGKPKGTSARAGGMMAPPAMRKKPGSPEGLFSKTNQDGDIFTRKSPYKRDRVKSMCFIVTACVEARGLPDDCYELRLLRVFRDEYVLRLPDGEAVLAEYREKAPRVVDAIGRLGEEAAAAEVWEHLYERGIARSVALITNGSWDEAYEVYREMCREMEERFLKGGMLSGPIACPSSYGTHQSSVAPDGSPEGVSGAPR